MHALFFFQNLKISQLLIEQSDPAQRPEPTIHLDSGWRYPIQSLCRLKQTQFVRVNAPYTDTTIERNEEAPSFTSTTGNAPFGTLFALIAGCPVTNGCNGQRWNTPTLARLPQVSHLSVILPLCLHICVVLRYSTSGFLGWVQLGKLEKQQFIKWPLGAASKSDHLLLLVFLHKLQLLTAAAFNVTWTYTV